jgi:putative membrane protein
MKKLILAPFMLFSICLFLSCGGNDSSADSSKDSVINKDTINAMRADTSASVNKMKKTVDKDASEFASKAASGGMMEVELGRIAQQKAASQRVKDFGAMMVQDHTAANDDLKSRVSSLDVALPSMVNDEDKKEMDKLSKKYGKDFDKAYMNMTLDDHKKDVAEFRKAADKCTEPSLKDFASKTLPVLEKHLDSAKAITGKH